MRMPAAVLLCMGLASLQAGDPVVGARVKGATVVATGQRVDPAGDLLTFPGRAVDLALAADGGDLFLKTDRGLLVVDPKGWRVRQTLRFMAKDTGSMLGLAPQGAGRVWVTLGGTRGILEAVRDAQGRWAWGRRVAVPGRGFPCGIALRGSRAVVALGLENQVAVMDLASGKVEARIPVGVAPCAVALSADGATAFVADWGGARARPGQATQASAGTPVAVDAGGKPLGGTVCRVDLAKGRVTAEVLAGLHPCHLVLDEAAGSLAVASANSDTVTFLDVRDLRVRRTVPVTPDPGLPFGSIPAALARDGRDGALFAACGGVNAVAVLKDGACRGFIPAGWFPDCLAADRGHLYVGSARGLGSLGAEPGRKGRIVTSQVGTLQRIALPLGAALEGWTKRSRDLARVAASLAGALPARPGRAPVPVPERAGEPSVFKHVVYVLKENRTYDQVLGDLGKGESDPGLCVFGRDVTPNHHALAEQFALLDNYYCNGVVSADGHQWATQGITTAYQEKAAGDWTRSYDFGTDPLAFAPTPFLWEAALARGRTFRNYGEFDFPTLEPAAATWRDVYRDHLEGTSRVAFRPSLDLAALRPYTAPGYPGWELRIPDAVRLDRFLKEFREAERTGTWYDLVLVYLPQDHTQALAVGAPTPRAHLADNDLALGRLVEALSRSRFWKDTVVFVNEDDPQDGWDHVDGHRSLCLVPSPYTKRGAVVSRFYNQDSVLHTIERILGLPPLNRMDALAPTLEDCFTAQPDLRPFTALVPRVPLDEMNPAGRTGEALDFSRPDRNDDDLLNRQLWRAVKGNAPYPADQAGAHGRGLARLGLKLVPAEDDD